MGWPGLATECKDICEKILISLISLNNSQESVSENIYYHNYEVMKEEMGRYTKLADIKHEYFREIQKYMELKSVAKVRMALRIRSKMVKPSRSTSKISIEILTVINVR